MVTNIRDGYYYRWSTTVNGIVHNHSVHLAVVGTPTVGAAFIDIDLTGKDLSTVTLAAFQTGLFAALAPSYDTTVVIGSGELWFAPNNTEDYSFVAGSTGSANGTGSVINESHQMTFTFRSVGGTIARFVLLESGFGTNSLIKLSGATGSAATLRDYVLDAASPILAIDDTYLVSPLNLAGGQNEKTWRQRNRP